MKNKKPSALLFWFWTGIILSSNCNSSTYNWKHLVPTCDVKNPKIKFFTTKEGINLSLEPYYLKLLASQFQATTFVETGTWKGNTTYSAGMIYDHVISIEISPQWYQNACNRFANNKNIKLYLGDSAKVLHEIANTIPGKPIFYLDAHYCGGNSGKGDVICPIFEELQDISNSKHRHSAIIIIDDIRFFYEGNDFYPSIQKVIAEINQMGSYQYIQVYDQLIAFPSNSTVSISPVVRACTISRLYDGTNFDEDEVINAELTIAQAQDIELNTIVLMAHQLTGNWKLIESALATHHPLWHGLVLLARGDYKNAYNCFSDAADRKLSHWRIEWYKHLALNHISFMSNPNYHEFKKTLNK